MRERERESAQMHINNKKRKMKKTLPPTFPSIRTQTKNKYIGCYEITSGLGCIVKGRVGKLGRVVVVVYYFFCVHVERPKKKKKTPHRKLL